MIINLPNYQKIRNIEIQNIVYIIMFLNLINCVMLNILRTIKIEIKSYLLYNKNEPNSFKNI